MELNSVLGPDLPSAHEWSWRCFPCGPRGCNECGYTGIKPIPLADLNESIGPSYRRDEDDVDC